MTEAIYKEVSVKTEKAKEQHRRISVCGMLKYLDVSRSGYPGSRLSNRSTRRL